MLISRHGDPTHRLLVKFKDPDTGKVIKAGERIAYSGDADWRFEPNDPQEAVRWRVSHADPVRVLETNRRGEVTHVAPNQ